MTYWFVEYGRAKRAIRIALIILGLFLLATILLRFSVHNWHWEADLENSPTAHVTRTHLPDGSTRIIVDDPQRATNATIVRHPDGAVDMDVVEPKAAGGASRHDDLVMGSTTIRETVQGDKLHTVLHYSHRPPSFDLAVLFIATIPMGLLVASILGGALGKENDGHLELAWTKPVSRERYAVASVLVDAAGIVISQLLTIAVALIATLMFFVPHFSYGSYLGFDILTALAGPIAWYALLTAASASLKRGPGVVIGVGWLAAILIPSLGQSLARAAQFNAIAAWFYAIFKGLSYLDPIAYFSFNTGSHGNFLLPITVSAWVLCALAVGYIALAVAQWRRVEA